MIVEIKSELKDSQKAINWNSNKGFNMKLLSKVIGVCICAVSVNGFANLSGCANLGLNIKQNYKQAIKVCMPYSSDIGAAAIFVRFLLFWR